VREGQGTYLASGNLPIVSAPEEGEVISSWLDRTARFYGLSLAELLAEHIGLSRPLEAISAVDRGDSPEVLAPVARFLGLSVEALMSHTILGDYSWARDLVSQASVIAGSDRTPGLRYAACPLCLEQQRAIRGFSWLRRDWLLAPRTVCSVHHVALVEMEEGSPWQPLWQSFRRQYELEVQQPVCASSPINVGEPDPADLAVGEMPDDPLYRLMARIQDEMVARATPQALASRQGDLENLTTVVDDLIWAFTRNDAIYGDRLVYEAFVSPGLDNPWHIARRRCAGPIAFRNLVLEVRHRTLATAVVLAGPWSLREKVFGPGWSWEGDIAGLRHRLAPNDRAELVERQKHWPARAKLGCQFTV
jgi:hypothetical protein